MVEIESIDLPSFLWLWKIAAWSMGLSVTTYFVLAITGTGMFYFRQQHQPRPKWLRPFHYGLGTILVFLVLLLLSVGLMGTLGYYGNLGHSAHLPAGLTVVSLVLVSAWSATQISPKRLWARTLHVGANIALLLGLIAVSITGWSIVQKYLP